MIENLEVSISDPRYQLVIDIIDAIGQASKPNQGVCFSRFTSLDILPYGDVVWDAGRIEPDSVEVDEYYAPSWDECAEIENRARKITADDLNDSVVKTCILHSIGLVFLLPDKDETDSSAYEGGKQTRAIAKYFSDNVPTSTNKIIAISLESPSTESNSAVDMDDMSIVSNVYIESHELTNRQKGPEIGRKVGSYAGDWLVSITTLLKFVNEAGEVVINRDDCIKTDYKFGCIKYIPVGLGPKGGLVEREPIYTLAAEVSTGTGFNIEDEIYGLLDQARVEIDDIPGIISDVKDFLNGNFANEADLEVFATELFEHFYGRSSDILDEDNDLEDEDAEYSDVVIEGDSEEELEVDIFDAIDRADHIEATIAEFKRQAKAAKEMVESSFDTGRNGVPTLVELEDLVLLLKRIIYVR